ncbi:dihydrolipoamide acetyltransferase family protein [Brevibacterium daeguense]|uniref:Dihydrolipoamide acetyltransferase component of pyruvate dehydrogenase complex n=1 Tax=Brevibacterium daeguense TaxID=909936 RepID=A0ABP8EI99_9MICO|nr:dihydrolipoamide acetyltransferase family protein [Brevibacterium daeguense]
MSELFILPDVGEGLTEAEIVTWKVTAGDTVTVNQVLVEIETAKSLVELPSPQAGTIGALLVEEGQTVEVGTPIVRFGEPGGTAEQPQAPEQTAQPEPAGRPEAPAAPADQGGQPADSGTAGPNLVGYGVKAASSKRRPRRGAGAAAAPAPAGRDTSAPAAGAALPGTAPESTGADPAAFAQQVESAGSGTGGPRPLAKPPVRKLAKDRGIDLSEVTPTGPRGEVTREDLLAHLEAGTDTTAAATDAAAVDTAAAGASAIGTGTGTGAEERIPLKGVGRMMAKAMVDSAFTAPHVTEFLDVDVTRTMEFVRHLKTTKLLGEDVRVSPLLVVARAVIWAAQRTPRINAVLDGEEIVVKHYVNLGIAAATPRGLIVPNIKDAHRMGLAELAAALTDLTETARAGRTGPAEQAGGTITITNVGVFGVDSGTPIINPGESAILAFGSVRKRPWVIDDELVVREVTTLSVSADHRVVDGEAISRFLADVGRALEEPLVMLA